MIAADAPIYSHDFYQIDRTDACRPYFLSWAESMDGLSGDLCRSIQEKLIRIFGDESIRLASALPKVPGTEKDFLYSSLRKNENGSWAMDKYPWPWHEAFNFVYVLSGEQGTEERLKMAFDYLSRKYGNVTAEDIDSLLQDWIQEKSPDEGISSYLQRLSEIRELEQAA